MALDAGGGGEVPGGMGSNRVVGLVTKAVSNGLGVP